MKRLCICLLTVMMVLSVAACGGKAVSSVQTAESNSSAQEPPAEAADAVAAAAESTEAPEPTAEPEPTLPPEPQPQFDGSAKFMTWGDYVFMVQWYTEDAASIAMDTDAAGKYVMVHLAETNTVNMSTALTAAADYFVLRDANGTEHPLTEAQADPAYNPDMPRYSLNLIFDVPADMAAVGMTLVGREVAGSAVIVKLMDVTAK